MNPSSRHPVLRSVLRFTTAIAGMAALVACSPGVTAITVEPLTTPPRPQTRGTIA